MVSTFPLQALLASPRSPLFFFSPLIYFFFYLTVLSASLSASLSIYLVQSLFVLRVAHIMIYFTVSLLPNPPPTPSLLCNFALSFAQPSRLVVPPSLPSSLHMSWHHRCVPNVPQTLFSTIKLLSLLSPAAARITWAEGALFKYRAALGRGGGGNKSMTEG